jgi:Heterokaryon incompatibility protein (HET)
MSDYVYRALNIGDIRLFNLSPGNFNDPLVGQLGHHSIDYGVPSYTALSYVWGDQTSVSKLQILPNSSKFITSNLACALRNLRSPDIDVFLWVDAICINQEDSTEKARQVSRMRDVYAIASEVVAFLGDKHHNQISDLHLLARVTEDDGAALNNALPKLKQLTNYLRPRDQDVQSGGLFDLLRRPWFSRIWVVQEALVARKFSFRCGTACIVASKLAEVLSQKDPPDGKQFELSKMEQQVVKDMYNSIGLIRNISSREFGASHTKQKADLLELLWFYRGYQATKARDHLFALLGLSNASYNPLLSPDYTASLETIVFRYARYFVESSKDPLRLLYSARGISSDNRFASWIPDWMSDEADPSVGYHVASQFLNPPKGFYSTALSRPLSIRMGKTDNCLVVNGSIFSYLTIIGENYWNNSEHEKYNFQLQHERIQESDLFISRKPTYPTGETLQDVQIRLLVGNRAWAPGLAYRHLEDNYVKQYHKYRRFLESGSKTDQEVEDLMSVAKTTTKATGWMHTFPQVRNLRFCSTKNGYLGLVPLEAEVGDVVCIINGSCVPFVLRPCRDIKWAFRLVGKCYIYGIMEGEAMEMKDLVQKEISLV